MTFLDHIANTVNAPEGDLGLVFGQFAADTGQQGVNGTYVAVIVVAPDGIQNILAGGHFTGAAHQKGEKLHFARGHFDRMILYEDLVRLGMHAQIAQLQNLVFFAGLGAAQDGFHTGDHFFGGEWLGHVIVGA